MSALLLVAVLAAAPVCHCPAQCDAMWAEAAASMPHYTGMRLRLATDSVIETYVPRVGLYGVVNRLPVAGGYEISGAMASRPDSANGRDLAGDGMNLFYRRVKSAGDKVVCPAP